MHTMTIEVQGKADPEKGKKRGRVKDASGMIFQADPAILASVIVGSKYDITYTDEEFKDFKYRVISEVNEVGKDSMTTRVSPIPAPPAPRPSSSTEVYSDTKTEDISALAIIKSMQIEPERSAVFIALREAAIGWRRYKKWQKTLASDMDDEIPG